MDVISNNLNDIRTLSELFRWRVALTPEGEAYRQFDAKTRAWRSTKWKDVGERVSIWSEALKTLKLPSGARVAILLPNGLDAVCIDQASLALAYVPVPMHALDNPGSIAYILSDCDASILMVATRGQWSAIEAVGTSLPSLVCVIVIDEDAPTDRTDSSLGLAPVISLASWLATTSSTSSITANPSESDLAAIVYTSGTTGKPKGVMLTHGNVMSNMKSVLARVSPSGDDVFLSFLPLSHTFERTIGYYLPIATGACVAYARSIPLIGEDLLIIRQTVLVSVPRIYERIYGKLQEVLAKSSLKMALFNWTQAVGWRRFCKAQQLPFENNPWSWLDAPAWPLLQRMVARPFLAQLGGQIKIAVSGGAALSAPIARCFIGLGLPLLQGYGMTETSPVVATNGINDNDPTTVGHALSGVEVKIGQNQELLVRGPSVMLGYWKRAEDTARIISADGWLSSGDQASIIDGRIRILGRIKEIIVTSTGEKIAPGDLERALTDDALFEQVLVVGENRPFISCIVVLKRDEWLALATKLGIDPGAATSLRAPVVLDAILERIGQLTKDFPRHAVPRKVWLSLEPWTIENLLMTPTLKLKRNNLIAHFSREIEALYKTPSA